MMGLLGEMNLNTLVQHICSVSAHLLICVLQHSFASNMSMFFQMTQFEKRNTADDPGNDELLPPFFNFPLSDPR